MTLTPLTEAPLVVQIHTLLACAALALTIAIFSLHKGSPAHRLLGWAWVTVMATVAISSFWIHELRLLGPFSPIHLLSIYVLYSLVIGVRDARAHRVKAHRSRMRAMTLGALLVAGAFTFLPGRTMFQVISGG